MEQQLTGFGLKTSSSHKLIKNKFLMKSSLVTFLKWFVYRSEQELLTLSQAVYATKLHGRDCARKYGQTQIVIYVHASEIMNLTPVKGTNFERVNNFYIKLSKSYDALEALGKSDTLARMVMTTIAKLLYVISDLIIKCKNVLVPRRK